MYLNENANYILESWGRSWIFITTICLFNFVIFFILFFLIIIIKQQQTSTKAKEQNCNSTEATIYDAVIPKNPLQSHKISITRQAINIPFGKIFRTSSWLLPRGGGIDLVWPVPCRGDGGALETRSNIVRRRIDLLGLKYDWKADFRINKLFSSK